MSRSAAIDRLRWHAGLQEIETADSPSVASSTWPRGQVSKALQPAVVDCLRTLAAVNLELNREGRRPVADVPRGLAYAVAEIVRMIRECHEHASEQRDAKVLARAAWRVETAWSAVLAGDVEDIQEHVKQEEAARFGS
jgi:hypothetical protein